MNALWFRFLIRRLAHRLTELTQGALCLAFSLTTVLLALAFTHHNIREAQDLENSLPVRTAVLSSLQDDHGPLARIPGGVLAVGHMVPHPYQFDAEDVHRFQTQMQDIADVFLASERMVSLVNDQGLSVYEVSPNYPNLMGIRWVAGDFNAMDLPAHGLWVTKTFAKAQWGTQNPIGQDLRVYYASDAQVRPTPITLKVQGVFATPQNTGVPYAWFEGTGASVGFVLTGTLNAHAPTMYVLSRPSKQLLLSDLLQKQTQGLPGVVAYTTRDLVHALQQEVQVKSALGAVLACMAMVGTMLTLNRLVGAWINNRLPLMGLSMALGAGPKRLLWDQATDLIVMVLFGFVLGEGLMHVLLEVFQRWDAVQGKNLMLFPGDHALGGSLMVMVMFLAGLPPCHRALQSRPGEVLREP